MPASNTAAIRKRLLHILLWCLAASAASGVLTVLVSDRDIMWRVTAMGIVSVIAIGLMIRCSVLADRAKFRTAGLFGMMLCVLAFLLSIGLIWAEKMGWRFETRFGMSLLLTGLMGPAVVGLLCLRAIEAGRLAGLVGLVLAAITTCLFLAAIWLEDLLFRPSNFAATGAALAATAAAATLCMIGLPTDKRPWRWIGVAAAAIGLLMALYDIWITRGHDSRYFTLVMSIAWLAAFANIILRARVIGNQVWVVYGTIAAAAAVALFVDLDAFLQEGIYSDPYGFERFTAGASIVTVSGTLAVLVLVMLNRRATRRDPFSADGERDATLPRQITLRCPRCKKEQTLPLGESACTECRLVIKTAIEVPACPTCGYDISTIRGNKCPECGAGIG